MIDQKDSKEGESLKSFTSEKETKSKKDFVNCYDSVEFSLNDKWYYMALLDLSTCSNFKSDPEWIAQRLGVPLDEVLLAIAVLEKEKMLKFENGRYKKVVNDLVVPTLSSREKIRQYHKVMSAKAIELMEKKTGIEDFNRRLIKGATIAVNPARLERAKDIINIALEQVIETLTEGECTL